MKHLRYSLLALILALTVIPAQAKDIDLKKFGARADGVTKVTKVLQKAIDKVSAAGGGRVVNVKGLVLNNTEFPE